MKRFFALLQIHLLVLQVAFISLPQTYALEEGSDVPSEVTVLLPPETIETPATPQDPEAPQVPEQGSGVSTPVIQSPMDEDTNTPAQEANTPETSSASVDDSTSIQAGTSSM
jgi:hypothetical protein